jgi:hypothetical protein
MAQYEFGGTLTLLGFAGHFVRTALARSDGFAASIRPEKDMTRLLRSEGSSLKANGVERGSLRGRSPLLVATAAVGVLAASCGSPSGTSVTAKSRPPPPSTTLGATGTTSTTITTEVIAQLPSGNYDDATANLPRYIITIRTNPSGFIGWLYVMYQDGRTNPIFHYIAVAHRDGTFTLQTDAASQPFNMGIPGDPSHVGSAPIAPGMTASGTYHQSNITLDNCGSYLYWAGSTASDGHPFSCSFSLEPGRAVG